MQELIPLAAAPTSAEPAAWMVVVMGLLVVFVGLICLVFLCKLLGFVVRLFEKTARHPAAPASDASIPDRPTLVAAISAAIAEEEGTDVGGIRILSIKKL